VEKEELEIERLKAEKLMNKYILVQDLEKFDDAK
jgi:hypothetical protein